MSELITPLLPEYSLQMPDGLAAWVVWVIWFLILTIATIRNQNSGFKFNRKTLIWLSFLSVLILFMTPFMGILIGDSSVGTSDARPFQHLMFFAAVPWMLAGGILGFLPAVMLAGISGLLLAYLDTHHIFTPLLFMSFALIFTWCIQQRYRTIPYRFLRFPLIGALISAICLIPMILLADLMTLSGSGAERMVSTLEGLPTLLTAFFGMILIGSFVCLFVQVVSPETWGSKKPLQPASGEKSLKFRLTAIILPFLIFALFVSIAVGWKASYDNTRRGLAERLTSTASMAANGVTAFVETGETLILDLANDERISTDPNNFFDQTLPQKVEVTTFFEEIILLNQTGEPLMVYPSRLGFTTDQSSMVLSEIRTVMGFPSGSVVFTQSAFSDQRSKIGFMVKAVEGSEENSLVLLGQTVPASNLQARSFVDALEQLSKIGGIGQVVMSDGSVFYHTNPDQSEELYSGIFYTTPTYFEASSVEEELSLQFYQPIEQLDWAVITSLPTRIIRVMTWEAVMPLIWGGIAGILIVLSAFWISLSSYTKSIDQLCAAVDTIAVGEFDNELSKVTVKGELGRIKDVLISLDQFLQSTRERETELLSLSDALLGETELRDAMRVVMMTALSRGVSSVRIILLDPSKNDSSKTIVKRYGLGKNSQIVAYLDQEVLDLVHRKGKVVLEDFETGTSLNFEKNTPKPVSVIAIPLKSRQDWLGVLWVTFQEEKNQAKEEIDFFNALSQKASLAAARAWLFDKNLQLGRQLETVLNVIPDAVLTINGRGEVIYQNQVAEVVFENEDDKDEKALKKVSRLIDHADLMELINHNQHTFRSTEVEFHDGRIYQVIISPTQIDPINLGQTIIFKDITRYRESDSRKLEYVTTVSHELRSPLTLIQGYAKILQLTGSLNKQQNDYIKNIIEGVEEMKNLVQNLLDIGRLESGGALEISQIDLRDLIRKVVDSMTGQAKQKNIDLSVSTPPSPFLIEADIPFLTQALKNLVDNAIKFTKMGGHVVLKVTRDGDQVVFSVKDNGIGIAPLDQKHLFEKFHRFSSPVEEKPKGSGLGLAIVKSIAERHHGKVWVESQLGRGSTFYLQIPAESV